MADQFPWMDILTGSGSLGVMAVLVWYIFTKTIPRLAGDFKEALSESRHDFKEMAKQERDDFRVTLKEQNDFFKIQIDAERVHVDKALETLVRRQ